MSSVKYTDLVLINRAGVDYHCTVKELLEATEDAKSSDYFQTVLYTGNGSTQTISGLGFSPGLVWIKKRSATGHGPWYDSVRGIGKAITSSLANSEYTAGSTQELTAFNSDGFSLGTDYNFDVNTSSQTFVGWCWDAGSSTVTHTAGSITSQVRANPSAGFSVATLTTPSSGNFTVEHGLNIAPSLVICKARNQAFTWIVYHKSAGAGNYLVLNTTAASTASSTVWQNTDPSSTLVYGNASNWGTADYVMYSFAPVAGYSSFGSFSAGQYVDCGFPPRLVMAKHVDAAGGWEMVDAVRGSDKALWVNSSQAEGSPAVVASLGQAGFGTKGAGSFIYAAWR